MLDSLRFSHFFATSCTSAALLTSCSLQKYTRRACSWPLTPF